MDGFAATAAIREREARTGGHIPIIALTANAMKGDRERCLKAGMDDYASMPIRRERILGLIDELTDGGETKTDAEAVVDAEPASDAPVLDEAALDELKQLEEGGYFSLAEFLEKFAEDGQERIAAMQRAVAAGDAETLEREAHTLKGGSRDLGAGRLADICAELEGLGREGSIAGSEDVVALVATEFARVQDELSRRF